MGRAGMGRAGMGRAGMDKMAWLTDAQPGGTLARWLLNKEKYIIGRRAPADLLLPFRCISRRHAFIDCRDVGAVREPPLRAPI